MTASITHFWQKTRDSASRLRLHFQYVLFSSLILASFLAIPSARADGVVVKTADLQLVDGVYQLNAEFELNFSGRLEEAVSKGVPLVFLVEFEVIRPRWYWFDENVATVKQTYRLSYNALTRQYQLAIGAIHHNFATFAEAKTELSHVREWQVLDYSLLKKGETYEAGVRMRLDVSQLPKPLQVNALASKEWSLESDWHRWPLIP
jgi:hypothetical protein